MLERRSLGEISAKPHTVFKPHGKSEPATEFVFTRDGFGGGFSMLYMAAAPTGIKAVNQYPGDWTRFVGDFVPASELPLSRRHIQTWLAPTGTTLLDARSALYRSATCRMSVVRGKVNAGDFVFSNGDADELYFVTKGSGSLLSYFGKLPFKQHDYVLIPRGTAYAMQHDGDVEMFVIEGDPYIQIPAEFRNPHGQLKMEAPYTHRDFRSPRELLNASEMQRFQKIVTLKNGRMTEHVYTNDGRAEIIGWDGSVYPMTFSINDYLPKTGKIHLPPNLHQTFAGSKMVVCSFVPRMVDYLEGAIPCPYPHANVHCDEILYYVAGNFTSRKGVKDRSVSYHPMGVPHGPQPGRYLGSVGTKSADELAVMVDVWDVLQHSRVALGLEDTSYPTSWSL